MSRAPLLSIAAALTLAAGMRPAANASPDLTSGMSTGQCANGPGNEGADSYFHGQFKVDGTAVTGTESWLLHANPKLMGTKDWAGKPADCKVVWNVTGTKTTDKGSCGACAFGLKIHAEPDVSASTCPEDLLLGRELPDGRRVGGEAVAFDQKYAVKTGQGEAITVYFAGSGKRLGQGYLVGNDLSYLSDHQCKWF